MRLALLLPVPLFLSFFCPDRVMQMSSASTFCCPSFFSFLLHVNILFRLKNTTTKFIVSINYCIKLHCLHAHIVVLHFKYPTDTEKWGQRHEASMKWPALGLRFIYMYVRMNKNVFKLLVWIHFLLYFFPLYFLFYGIAAI